MQGFPLTEDLEKVILKLQHQIEEHESPRHDLILFENADKLKNVNFLQHLFESIAERTVLKIFYRFFNSKKSIEKIIHPYFLKQYNNRWFLFGYDEINNRLDNSPIDRIESFKPINREFRENIQFFPKEYFKDMIGVTRNVDSKAEKIIFSVSKNRVDYIITKPVHTSQTEIKKYKNGWTDFFIEVIINKELFGLFLSFGHDIVVKSPKKFKEEFKQLLQKTFENYK
ncbi:MAG: helix-turn-helix transcriptional regulator [Chitinophagaceae bacterium]